MHFHSTVFGQHSTIRQAIAEALPPKLEHLTLGARRRRRMSDKMLGRQQQIVVIGGKMVEENLVTIVILDI